MTKFEFKLAALTIVLVLTVLIGIQVRERIIEANALAVQHSKAFHSEKMVFTGYNRAAYFERNDMEGIVSSCVPFPTNNPVIFVTEVIHKGWDNSSRHYRMCTATSLLTNGQPVIVKRISLDDTESKRIPLAVPVIANGTNSSLTAQK